MRKINEKLSSHSVWFPKELFDDVSKWNEENPDMAINVSGVCRDELKRVIERNKYLKEMYEKKK